MIGDVVCPSPRADDRGDHAGAGPGPGEAVAVYLVLSITFGTSIQLNSGGISIASLIAARFGSGGTYGPVGLRGGGFVLFVFTPTMNLVPSIISESLERSADDDHHALGSAPDGSGRQPPRPNRQAARRHQAPFPSDFGLADFGSGPPPSVVLLLRVDVLRPVPPPCSLERSGSS